MENGGKMPLGQTWSKWRLFVGTDFTAVRYGDIDGVPRRFIKKTIAERKTLKPFDILIETAGGTKDQLTGRTVLLKPGVFEQIGKPITCASTYYS